MSFESVYSCLIDSAVFFLGSWVVFLLGAYAQVFGSDTPRSKGWTGNEN
jgi:hypothetical protein